MIVPCLLIVYLLIIKTSHGDLGAYYDVIRRDWPEFTPPLKFLSNWGNIALYPVYAGILAWGVWRKRPDAQRFAIVYLIVQLLISFALVRLLKIGVGCPRPDVDGLCLPFSLDHGHHALPSGHTAEITGAVLPLVMAARPLWPAIVAGGFVALMAYSRVYLGWHQAADVAFGFAFGGFAAWLIYTYGKRS